jgi:lipopolysaccharide transport system permease protein
MKLSFFLPLRQRSLIWQFSKRDVLARYRGSFLGLGWSLVTPLMMLAIYTFVFRTIFKARWEGGNASDFEFALRVYSGLIVFTLFAEVLNRAPRLVLDQPNLVKKVVFPLEILPWVPPLAGIFHLVLNLLLLLVATAFDREALPLTILALPLVLLPLMPLLLAIGWFFGALGVFVRDIGQVMPTVSSLLMFLSPVFFPPASLPEKWQSWLNINPLTLIIEETRRVVLDGLWPHWGSLATYLALASLAAWLAGLWFQTTRKGFADVL